MNWLSLVSLLVQLVLEVVRYLERRALIKQTEAAQLEVLMERANAVINDAQLARKSVSQSDDDILSDPLNRQNWPADLDSDTDSDRPGSPRDGV